MKESEESEKEDFGGLLETKYYMGNSLFLEEEGIMGYKKTAPKMYSSFTQSQITQAKEQQNTQIASIQ
jgi:hypothetical protein